ncbi:MAG TPA: hypothetical protein DCX08_12805 [Porticoccaceae bacterium]|jgi:8-oxo-dGTP pyrophosphatase MutT (NUDIX family)|nr:hypothetical protein [Porticoccaceae bacterium]
MLTTIANHFVKFPLKKTLPVEGHMTSAAVLVVLWGSNDDPKVILTQRSEHLKSHAGEVAFPGGKWDPEDTDLLQTALRETFEEIGLSSSAIRPIAMLPSGSPRLRDIQVTPFVAIADNKLFLKAQEDEIAAIFHTPLKAFMDVNSYEYHEMKVGSEFGGGMVRFPFLMFEGYKIWGFTLKVIVDLLNSTLNAGIDLEYPWAVNKQDLE